MALTEAVVWQAKTTGKDYTLDDTDGLVLFVTARGAKMWHFRFIWIGKQQRVAVGSYPKMSLKDAREQRDDLRADGSWCRSACSPSAFQGGRAGRTPEHLCLRLQGLARLQGAEPENRPSEYSVADRPHFCQGRAAPAGHRHRACADRRARPSPRTALPAVASQPPQGTHQRNTLNGALHRMGYADR